jgi:hypothetical protein
MKTEDLKAQGFTDEQIKYIMAENGKDIEAEKAKIKVETEKLTKANETIKSLQETVKKFDGVDVEQLKKDLADAETKYTAELSATKLNYALEARLAKEGAVNSKAVKALLDISKISLDGDNLIGIDEQLKVLKEKEKWAFTQPTPDVPGVGGNPPPTPQNKPPLPSGTVIF